MIGTRGGGRAARPFPIVPLKMQTMAVACGNLPRSSPQGASVLRNNTSILRAAFSHLFSANEKTVLKIYVTESFICGTRLRDLTRSETSSDNDGFPRFFSVPRLQFHEALANCQVDLFFATTTMHPQGGCTCEDARPRERNDKFVLCCNIQV